MSAAKLARGSMRSALRSRLGRRFVLLFAGCALLPLVVFAALSVLRVTRQRNADLHASLHTAAKNSGMALAANLAQIAGDLALAAELVQSWRAEGVWSDRASLRRQVETRCAGIWLVEGQKVEALVGALAPPEFHAEPRQRAHLATGKPLALLSGPAGDVVVVLDVTPERPGELLVMAQARREWLWDPQVLRGAQCDFAACDARGRFLSHTFGSRLPSPQLPVAGAGRGSSGSFEWQVAGDLHLAHYWQAFLQPQYAIDIVMVQSRSLQEAMAVGDSFVRWFWLTAAATLLSVLLASLVQIRRTLDPIVSLREASQRFGRGELGERVEIESEDEFGELGAAFNDMARRLQENIQRREATERELVASRDAALAAAAAKAEFVTNVSHEFRTPMAEILGATEILAELGADDGAARAEFAAIAMHGARRLAALLDDVLALNRSDPPKLSAVDLAASLRVAVVDLPLATQRRVQLELGTGEAMVHANMTLLRELWQRLLGNAAKFSAPDTRIEVRLGRRGQQYHVDIVDHGVGIAAEDLTRVFEPFQQVGRDQLTDKAGGTGLGLTLAKNIVDAHGGRIQVFSEVGRGSTFRVWLSALVTAPVAAVAVAVADG